MEKKSVRLEYDSMGSLEVPENALYGAQTQRAINNFPISGLTMPRAFIKALGLIKYCAATVNADLKLLDLDKKKAICDAAEQVISGELDSHFPIDVFQTGSGTSSNMNVNEVIAHVASKTLNKTVHPNDDVNMGQSSNDVIPTAIHVSAALMLEEKLFPALTHLKNTIDNKALSLKGIIKTGRTHLMDALPIRFDQELGGWSAQIQSNQDRLESVLPRLHQLALGGTAIGTGLNAHPKLAKRFVKALEEKTNCPFTVSKNFFESISAQDTAAELSSQLRVLATSLTKISNDLRWMNSGPLAGIHEIMLPSLQPGSSIMPGKVNPVIPEAVLMVCAQVMGNDLTLSLGAQSGNFQLNTMFPLIAYNLLQSIEILSNAVKQLADGAIHGFQVSRENIDYALSRNPILVTALNSVIGYEKGAEIAKTAYRESRPLIEVAQEMTSLSLEELENLLDPERLTEGGILERE